MYNQPYFIPNYTSLMTPPYMMQGMRAMRGLGATSTPLINGTRIATNTGKGLGLMGKIGNSLSTFRSINWNGLINGASKTLGVVNQAIPLVRQVGPMMNNMKSMLKIASVFKDETDSRKSKKIYTHHQNNYTNQSYKQNLTSKQNKNNTTNKNIKNSNSQSTITNNEDNSPTFFIPV